MNIKILEGSVNYYREEGNTHVLAFGEIKENSVTKVKVSIEGVQSSSLSSTCGCSSIAQEEKDVYTIQYHNTNILKPFSKVMLLTYVEGGTEVQGYIKITGIVTK
jgi:hypothetical protein